MESKIQKTSKNNKQRTLSSASLPVIYPKFCIAGKVILWRAEIVLWNNLDIIRYDILPQSSQQPRRSYRPWPQIDL